MARSIAGEVDKMITRKTLRKAKVITFVDGSGEGGGTGTIIEESHLRVHSVINSADHQASAVGDRGKYVRANPSTGAIYFHDLAQNLDGGAPDSVYLLDQILDGGGP